ncbi:MAG TPA: hypothetical protein V6C65_26910 [Allocoleopsis sp.]
MKHHQFPLIDRNGQRVIVQRTGEEGVISGKGTCAYYVKVGDETKTLSAYELDYPDEPPENRQQRPAAGSLNPSGEYQATYNENDRLVWRKVQNQGVKPLSGEQLSLF